MAIQGTQEAFSLPVEDLKTQLDDAKKVLDELHLDRVSTIRDLESFDTEGYERFKDVLSEELNRLAHLRMDLDPADVRKGDRIQGQYNQTKRLMRRREDLQNDIGLIDARISEITGHLDELQQKLNQQGN